MAFQLQGKWDMHIKITELGKITPDTPRAEHTGAPAKSRFINSLYIYKYTKHVGLIKPNFSVIFGRVTGEQSKTGYNDSLIIRISNTIIVLFYPFLKPPSWWQIGQYHVTIQSEKNPLGRQRV